jgi:hypothetical protein
LTYPDVFLSGCSYGVAASVAKLQEWAGNNWNKSKNALY